MVTWFKNQLTQNPNFVNYDVLLGDEANFFVNGEVNKTVIIILAKNPNWMEPIKEHSFPKVVVWCRLWRNHVLGPFFNEIATSEVYLKLLQNYLMTQLEGKKTILVYA